MRLEHRPDATGRLQPWFPFGEEPEGVEELTREECLELMSTEPVGRIAFERSGRIVILPVNYALDDDGAIVFRTTRGSKLATAEREVTRVAFEVDHHDPSTGEAWSVVVRGPMEHVLDVIAGSRLERLGIEVWAQDVRREDYVRIRPDEVQGQRLHPRR